jgi:NTP pyrophosphatase (non-canonical NTP hydrolase)
MAADPTQENQSLTLRQIISDYQDIHLLLNAQWPIESKNERLFARMLKLTEELGELSNEVLTKLGLQRQEKIDAYEESHLEDELADVIGSAILLAVELDIDLAEVMKRKIDFTVERLSAETERGEATTTDL